MIYLARFIVELLTPLHCGAGSGDDFDQPVDRDGRGLYRLPGSSVAGILRARASQSFAPNSVDSAFGSITPGQSDGRASVVWCHDGRLLDYDGAFADERERPSIPLGPFIRDHVRIDFESGAAQRGGKFDEEYVPAGARFALEFFLDGWGQEPDSDSLEIFKTLGAALMAGDLRFGGKAAEGFGRVEAIYGEARYFNLRNEKGCLGWLNLSPGPRFTENEGEAAAFTSGARRQHGAKISGHISLPMTSQGPILIAGSGAPPSAGAKEADLNFYSEPYLDYGHKKVAWKKVIPGSSFRGVIRHRVFQIAVSLAGADRAQDLVNQLFGQAGDDREATKPGRVFFQDAVLADVQPTIVQHVALDRFTGGALDGALYDEAPVWQENMELPLKLNFEKIDELEAALLLQAIFDLAEGQLALGAGGNRGNGFLKLKGEGSLIDRLKNIGGEINWDGQCLRVDQTAVAADWLKRLDAALSDLSKREAV